MRLFTASICFLFFVLSNAQNWALINPAYKYNYSLGGTDTITNQIFATQVDTLGVDSFRYELNLIATKCDTCSFAGSYWIDQPQFMQRNVTTGPSIWHFQDPGSFVLLPQATLGETWTFDTLENVTATVTIVDQVQLFGNDVQRKVIGLSNGDSIVISDDFGVLNWKEFQLIGTHGPDVGELIPSLDEMYPYQAGDAVEYVTRSSYFDGFSSWIGQSLQYKFTFATGIVGLGSITYSGSRINHWWSWWNNPNNSGGHSTTYTNSWIAGAPELPWANLAISYPGQFVPMIDPSEVHRFCIAEHGIDSLGRYRIKTRHVPLSDQGDYGAYVSYGSQQVDTLSLVQFGSDLCYEPSNWGCGAEYVAGVGLMWSHMPHWEGGGEFYDLVGASINGDTTGIVHSDEYIIALSIQTEGKVFQVAQRVGMGK